MSALNNRSLKQKKKEKEKVWSVGLWGSAATEPHGFHQQASKLMMKEIAITVAAIAAFTLVAMQSGVNLEARSPDGIKICTSGEGPVKGHRICIDVYLLPLIPDLYGELK